MSRERVALREILARSSCGNSEFSGIALLGFLLLFKAKHTSPNRIRAASIKNTLREAFPIIEKAEKRVLATIFFNPIEEIESLEGVQGVKSVLRGSEQWSSTETVNRGYEQDSDNH